MEIKVLEFVVNNLLGIIVVAIGIGILYLAYSVLVLTPLQRIREVEERERRAALAAQREWQRQGRSPGQKTWWR